MNKKFNINPFRTPSAEEIAINDLEEAKRNLLAEQAKAEYHSKMVEYYRNKVNRLREFVEAIPA